MFVILAPLISGEMTTWSFSDIAKLFAVILTFISASISVYCLNDIIDFEFDRASPVKWNRPVAAGSIGRFPIAIFGIFLLTISLLSADLISSQILYLVVVYLLINMMYSLFLKRVPFWEMFIVASGFFIRVLAGTTLVIKKPSSAFYIVVFFGALLIVLSKRIAELKNTSSQKRTVLEFYSLELLSLIASICAGLLSGSYIYFIFSNYFIVFTAISKTVLYFTVLPFLAVVFELLKSTLEGDMEEPETVYLTNRYLIANGAIWLFLFVSVSHL